MDNSCSFRPAIHWKCVKFWTGLPLMQRVFSRWASSYSEMCLFCIFPAKSTYE